MSKSTTKSTTKTAVLSVVTSTDNKKTDIIYGTLTYVPSLDFDVIHNLDELFITIINNHITKVYIHDDDYVMSYIYYYMLNNDMKYDPNMDEGYFYEEGSYNAFILKGITYYLKFKYTYETDEIVTSRTCMFCSSKRLLRNDITKINSTMKYYNNISLYDMTKQLNTCEMLTNDIIETTIKSGIVVARYIKDVKRIYSMSELTIGSNAVKSWKKLDKTFGAFPLLDINIERDIYKAYRGGYNYLNPNYLEKDIGEGIVLDCNSLFPFVMRYFPCPVGTPTWHEGIPNCDDDEIQDSLFIIKMYIGGDESAPGLVLKDKMLPTISSLSLGKVKNKYERLVYNSEVWMTNLDFDLMINHYSIYDLNIIGYYTFDNSKEMFKNFVDHWYNIKANSTGANREIAKLMLDNIHGKLGTKIENFIGGKYIHTNKMRPIIENNRLVFKKECDTNDNSIRYVPASIFINSIARWYMILIGNLLYDRLIYMDTDSIHLIGTDPVNVVWHDSKNNEIKLEIGPGLGQFKVEAIFKRARYLGLKTYAHDEYTDFDKFDKSFKHGTNTKFVVKMAGASDVCTSKINFDNFYINKDNSDKGIFKNSKIMINNIIGGKIRVYTDYTIKRHDD